ncbi:hypothetical protein ONZ45_g6893 [Pleurotus djamor]|nr:hypothetical protein ONZ45_g6893 [Pleurotus djamor]
MVVCSLLLFIALLRHPPETEPLDLPLALAHNHTPSVPPMILPDLSSAQVIPPRSLTAILPVSSPLLLETALTSLLSRPSCLHEIWVVCPQHVISEVKHILRRFISSLRNDFPSISLYPTPSLFITDLPMNAMRLASRVETEWLLILDEDGLSPLDNHTQERLLNPVTASLPIGPHGFAVQAHSPSCISPQSRYEPADYLVPPFSMPSTLAHPSHILRSDTWLQFGKSVSASTLPLHSPGGIVFESFNTWCTQLLPALPSSSDLASLSASFNLTDASLKPPEKSRLLVFFPTIKELRLFESTLCSFAHQPSVSLTVVLQRSQDTSDPHTFAPEACTVHFPLLFDSDHQSFPYLDDLPHLVIALDDLDTVVKHQIQRRFPSATLIQLPVDDLPFTPWMASLSISELQNWHSPQVDLSVITKDRPKSLTRLLTSLSRARFFGDTVQLRLNIDQSEVAETQHVVSDYKWLHGPVFVHHRVRQGGLLPAVVESWYPSSNHSYGLLLEDDVEVSPLFYAWVKMSLLRYRYGSESGQSQSLFGISLYQPKNIELTPLGREPFNARTTFRKHGYPHPSTPYLSQIPCSWGAVYFPEHWREFHGYLSARLAETFFDIDAVVVPKVRSNRWKKSWKKFFIELVYLRGYVMLYPNYEDFLSLSTNHVEVGSHVKARTRDKKLELFLLPLMKLNHGTSPNNGLLDLPRGTLPAWTQLPVLDLVGSVTSSSEIMGRGLTRRGELTGCPMPPTNPFDTNDLMCTTYIHSPQTVSVISL